MSAPYDDVLVTGRALRRPAAVLWVAVFLYAALAAILVQTVVLPYWAPRWHAGHGLLAGLDAVSFHEVAVRQAEAIRRDGWLTWTLRPEGHLAAGVLSPLYALTVPEPWVLIPVNAALHATAAVVLFRILEMLAPVRVALLGVLPLVLFPSSLTWYAQIHKDGFAVLGALLAALGWARVARAARDPAASLGRGLLPIVVGAGAVWLARPYLVDVLFGLGIGLAALVTGMVLVGAARGRRAAGTAGRAVIRTWAAALVTWSLVALPGGHSYIDAPQMEGGANTPTPPAGEAPSGGWTRSRWLPPVVDRGLESLVQARSGFARAQAGSLVDADVKLTSAAEVTAYLPRALQVALFAPFPSQWAGGVTPGASVMRRVAGAEVLLLYLAVAILPWGLWRWRDRPELHVLVVYCLGMMLVYALAVPNVGALYRFRYPFETLLIGLAVALALVRSAPRGSPPTREATGTRRGAGPGRPGAP